MMRKESLKKELYQRCMHFVTEKIDTIQSAIKSAQASSATDQKSSMGDKYETTQAMMHLEIENQSFQLVEATKLLQTLHMIQPEEIKDRVELGALVATTTASYYISVSAGKLTLNGDTFFAISLSSPIGKKLISRRTGDSVDFNGQTIVIKNIF
ncbi:MAG: 3-oxoacyl-ACP synthase [Bacteroidota bacterium]